MMTERLAAVFTALDELTKRLAVLPGGEKLEKLLDPFRKKLNDVDHDEPPVLDRGGPRLIPSRGSGAPKRTGVEPGPPKPRNKF
jgi:hypothetical protein